MKTKFFFKPVILYINIIVMAIFICSGCSSVTHINIEGVDITIPEGYEEQPSGSSVNLESYMFSKDDDKYVIHINFTESDEVICENDDSIDTLKKQIEDAFVNVELFDVDVPNCYQSAGFNLEDQNGMKYKSVFFDIEGGYFTVLLASQEGDFTDLDQLIKTIRIPEELRKSGAFYGEENEEDNGGDDTFDLAGLSDIELLKKEGHPRLWGNEQKAIDFYEDEGRVIVEDCDSLSAEESLNHLIAMETIGGTGIGRTPKDGEIRSITIAGKELNLEESLSIAKDYLPQKMEKFEFVASGSFTDDLGDKVYCIIYKDNEGSKDFAVMISMKKKQVETIELNGALANPFDMKNRITDEWNYDFKTQ